VPYSTVARNPDNIIHPKYKDFTRYYKAYEKAAAKRDFMNAAAPARKALKLAREIFGESSRTTGFMYDRLGYTESATGNYDRALELYNRTLKIYKKIFGTSHENIATVYINIGEAYRAKGDIGRALEFHTSALEIYRKKLGDNHIYVATACNFIGGAYKSKGDNDLAIKYYSKALAVYITKLGKNHQFVATTYVNLGGAHESKGEYAKAVEYYLKAIPVYMKTLPEDHPFVAVTYNNLGLGYYFLQNTPDAIKYYKKALDIYLKTLGGNHPHSAYTYINLGLAYRSGKNFKKALNCYNNALKALKQSSDRDGHIRVLSHMGDLYASENRLLLAAASYKEGADLILKYRLEIGRGKAGFLGRYVFMFNRLINIRLSLKEPEKAFLTDCMKKGLSIAEDMTLKQALYKGSVPEKDQALFLTSVNRVEMLESDRSVFIDAGNEVAAGKLLKKIWENEQEKERIDRKLIEKYPGYAALRSPSVPSVRELMKMLSRDEVLISYSLDKQRSMAYIISHDHGLVCVSLESDYRDIAEEARNIHTLYKYSANETVFTDIRTASGEQTLWNRKMEENRYHVIGHNIYANGASPENNNNMFLFKRPESVQKINIGYIKGEISNPDIRSLRDTLCRRLYRRILSPLKKHIGKAKKIIIIPDGPLYYVPMGLLKDSKDNMLAAQTRIVLVHSPTVWLRIKQKKDSIAALPLLAVGNAVYSRGHRIKGSARRGATRSSGIGSFIPSFSSLPDNAGYNAMPVYNNLPGTAEEIKAITLTAYGENKSNEHILDSIDANEDRILEMSRSGTLDRYRVLHFAAHGLFRDREPSLNAIVLSLPDIVKQYRKKEYQIYSAIHGKLVRDGFLRLGEIKTMNLNCDLVVMSACETSMGHFLHGEGMIGLPQAFLIAGSRAVVASLWPVDDEAAFILMEEFYKNIFTRSMEPADALYFAQKALREEYNDPYYWAPFVIYGR